MQDALRKALKDGTLTLPEPFDAQLPQMTDILRKLAGQLEIKNADERRQVKTRQAVLHSAEFKALWDRIKHKTTYRVQFDNEKLIGDCIKALSDAPPITKTRLQWRKADIAIGKAASRPRRRGGAATVTLDEADIELPDVLTDLQDDPAHPPQHPAHPDRAAADSTTSSATRSSSSSWPPRPSTAASAWRWWTASSTSGSGDEHYYAQELFETGGADRLPEEHAE